MSEQKPFRFHFFLPDARLLSEEEIDSMPESRKEYASAKQGLWLEIQCPDASCIDSEGRITLPPGKSGEEGFFLDLFCPGGSCEVVQSTDLP